ncbi:hypothetical protein [Leptospira perolatii]|uniref:hypothetical protein n=1 Tax=Leptospira perolatii TaxID=2023191 RepID=UPI0013FE1174|nr:hypothetical protein [Leptospira perolatii]
MAATPIQTIPALEGENAEQFVTKADAKKRPEIPISEQQRKIYQALLSKSNS